MSQDSRIGQEIAGYTIESLLGRGGMSVVYLATQEFPKRKVALKLLAPELVDEPGFRERFIRESNAAASLDHPNVIPIYGAGEDQGVLWIAMRYVEGTDLAHLIRDEGALSPERTVRIVEQVASALDAAHEIGLVHRDVKPGNILLARSDHAYLTDFGIIKRREAGTEFTKTGQFLGSVDYAAPEQIRGDPVDGRADVYSLGCVIFECLTGEPPFPRESELATMYAHVNDAAPRPSASRSDLPGGIDAVVAKAMAKSADDRQVTCGELAAAARTELGAAAGGAEVDQHPRRISRVASIAITAGALLIAVSLATVIVMGGRNEPGSPPQSPHSSRASEASSGPTASPLMVDRPFNALERQLLFHIPPDLRPRCGPALEQQEEADASIACRVDDSVRAYYYHYGSVEAMDGEFDNVAVSLGQEGNNCALDHNAVQSYTVGGHPVGRVLCLRTESDSRIEWTDPRFLILSLALRADLGDQDLYEWWKQAAGPMETGSTDVAPKGPSVPIATLPDESYLTSVDARDVARPRLRFQSGIKGVSTPSGWIGLWALRLSDGTYSVTQDGRTVEQGTVALGKGHEAEFTATSGDCAGRTAATAKYVWRLTADVAMFLNTQGGAYCAGPFPINIDSWIAVSGGELAFTGSGPNLELMSIDGTDRRLLTSNGFQPDWSPDGSRLAFGRGDGGEARIFLVNADGSGATQLDHGPGYEDTPRWSPDGSEIAFVRRRDIFVMDDAGGNVHPLIATPANEGWVSWFPDGSGVVFSKGGLHPLSSGAEVAGRADIFVADLSGRVQHRLTQGSGANVAPAPSPDSKTIAFFGNQGGKLDLYLMDRDGTNVRKLVDVGSEEQVGYPTWSPDGSLIAYPRTRNGDTEIFLTTANGQAAVQLTHGNSAEPCWRPGSNS